MPLQLPFWSSFSCLQATQNNHALQLCIFIRDSSCVQTVRSHLLQYILRLKATVSMTMFAEGAYVWTGMQPLHVLPGLSLLHWVHGDTRDVPDTGDADYSMQI